MKNLLIITLAILISVSTYGQDEPVNNNQEMKTLFGSTNMTHGGYGAISFNYTQIDGKDAFLIGGRGSWVINHRIALGAGGYGFANELNYDFPYNGAEEQFSLAGGYGGLIIEPIIAPFYPVHVSVPILIGAGGVSYVNNYWNNHNDPSSDYYYTLDANAFFVVEPGVEVEFNVVKFMRISLGAYYRYTSKINLYETKDDVLNGFSTGISLKFGKF
jgi:hypothetical protein